MKNQKTYELSNHLSNVIAVVSDRKIGVDVNSDNVVDYFSSEVLSASDYYAFGAPMPGRKYVGATEYRYSMNGQEKDKELFEGAMSAEYWEYDARTGRRWNTDPIYNPWESMYACFRNNPILYVDIKGNTADVVIVGGTEDNKKDFLGVLNKGLGGFYTASIDKSNQLQLTKTDQKGEMNESQKAVFESFNDQLKIQCRLTLK